MALSVVKGTIDRVLDKNLQDLVRGIRNHKSDESKYINECLDEIRNDLKQSTIAVKSNALAKLIYLQMLGCDISWAVFNIVEIISSHRFTFKRVGYLAAAQSFHYDMDVLMLTTNQIHKDLASMHIYDCGVALSGLSCFINQELAMNLYSEILALTISPKPYLRKKSVLLLYKVFLHHPEALPVCFPRLREKLEDPDAGVQCAAVNVICELARKNPRNYLSLAPVFFNMMKNSTNNWVLIKIIKLFGALTPLEPRLGKKLIEPLTNLIHSTSAMSLLYECINTIVAVLFSISSGVPDNHAAIQLCVQKLRVLIEDSDQNLKYLGLLAMGKILRHHAKSLHSHKDLVLACLHDKDESVRLRALSLLHGMVTKRSLVEIVQSIIGQIGQISASSHYCSELVAKVIHVCAQENYHYVTSFEWYISVLVELARMDGVRDGGPLADQLIEVAIRVPSVRGFCVDQMAILVDLWPSLVSTGANQSALQRVMEAAGWICGEYAHHLTDARHTLTGMFSAANSSAHLPGRIQAVLLFNAFKLYCSLVRQWAQQLRSRVAGDRPAGDAELPDLGERLLELTSHVVEQLTASMHSPDLEVQERAVSLHQLCSLVAKRLRKLHRSATDTSVKDGVQATGEQPDCHAAAATRSANLFLELIDEVAGLFAGEINRVAPKAQRKVPVPPGLDLDAWINPPPSSSTKLDGDLKLTAMLANQSPLLLGPSSDPTGNVSPRHETNTAAGSTQSGLGAIFPELPSSTATPKLTQSELEERRVKRLQEQQDNPHYLKPKPASAVVDGGVGGEAVTLSQSEALTPTEDSKATGVTAIAVGSAVRECAKPDQFVKQIRQQFLQLDIRENASKSKRKQSTRTSRKSTGRGRARKNSDQTATRSEVSPSVLVLADYDRPEGASSADSSLERQSISGLHRRLDLGFNGALPPDFDKLSPVGKELATSARAGTKASHRRRVNKDPNSTKSGTASVTKSHLKSGSRHPPAATEELVNKGAEDGPLTEKKNNHGTSLSPGKVQGNKAIRKTSKMAHQQQTMKSDENPVSKAVFTPVPMAPDQLVQQLQLQGHQSLSSKLSGRLRWSGTDSAFHQLVSTLSASIPCTIVERIGLQIASLYAGYGCHAVPVCCLLKHSSNGFVHFSIRSVTSIAAVAFADGIKLSVACPSAD